MPGASSTSGREPEGSTHPPGLGTTPLTARTAAITISAQSLARALGMAAGVLSVAIVARVLDIATYADWATVISLVVIVGVIIDPSLSPVIVRRIAQDPGGTPTAGAMIPLRLVLGVVALAIVAGGAVALRGPDALLLSIALGAQLVARSVVLNALPWLQTDHRLHRLSALEAGAAVVGLALLGAVAAADGSATVMALAGMTAPTIVLAFLSLREVRMTPSSRLPPAGPQQPRIVAVLREMAPLALAVVLTALITRVHTAFVNIAEDDEAVAQYLFAFTFIEQVIVLAGIVAGALLPMLAARAKRGDLFADPGTRDLLLTVAALGALGSAGLLALASPLCSLIGGENLADADRYLRPLTPMVLILLLAFMLAYVHLALGLGGRYLRINLGALVLTLLLNGTLTLSLGAGATARVAWVVELFVVLVAFLPLLQVAAPAWGTLARILALVALCVAGAELATADVVPPLAAAASIVAVTLVLEGRGVARLIAQIRTSQS